nr:FAD-dependent oxidoreductase [Bacteriovorax sp. HI3]
MKKDYIIIGAGLSGLNTAKKLVAQNLGEVLILEKSRGLGGRMATRRTLDARFDHGAQFYRKKVDLFSHHDYWRDQDVNQHWFLSDEGDHWCGKAGMTTLAKKLGEGLTISLEKEVQSIHFENGFWKLLSKKNEEWQARHLIITSPIPQTIKLLGHVEKEKFLNPDQWNELQGITYTKALIALVTLEGPFSLKNGYVEFQEGDFFSISDQYQKGVSPIPALTVTMSALFSEKEFENEEAVVLEKILTVLKTSYPEAKIKNAELKKWRYCRPEKQLKDYFFEIAPKLYLAGDAFGGSSLGGAVRSSESLCRHLLGEADEK